MNQQQAFELIVNAIDASVQKGVFTLTQVNQLLQALNTIKPEQEQ